MKDFFLRAWANPTTTFNGLAALATALLGEFADAGPTVKHALNVAAMVFAALALMAARDSGTPAALNAAATSSAPKVPPLPVLALLAVAALFLAGCTPAARSTAATALNTGGTYVPYSCVAIDAVDPAAIPVCGPITAAVSDVAKLIASILQSMPPASRKGAVDTTPTPFGVSGCTVTLPKWQADYVRARLGVGV